MLGILYRCRRSMWLEYWLNEHQGSDFPASVPSLAALPAWVGLEKDGCTLGLRHISVEDSVGCSTSLPLPACHHHSRPVKLQSLQRPPSDYARRPAPADRRPPTAATAAAVAVRCPRRARFAPVGQASQRRPPHQRTTSSTQRAVGTQQPPPPPQTALTSSRAKHAGPISLRLSREPQGSSSSTPAAPRQRRRRGHAPSAPDNGERSTRGTSSPARHPSSRAHPRQPTAWPTHPSTTRTRTPTTSSSAPRGSSATRSPSSTRARPPAPAR
jgi:hypothetical protein